MNMHAQAHISGHMSGQVPGSQLSDLARTNGNPIPSQMHSLGLHNTGGMSSDFEKIRQRMRERIFLLFQRRRQATAELVPRMEEMARRLEEVLYKDASTKEEYMDVSTLEGRLQTSIKRISVNQSLPFSHSASIGTMMPTAGMVHRGSFNSSIPSSVVSGCSAGTADAMNAKSSLPTSNGSIGGVHGGSFSATTGAISNGYQQSPASSSIGSNGNNLISSTGMQRAASQMMPTPGLSNTNVLSEPFSSAGILSGNDSTFSPKSQPPKQYAGRHGSHILHNFGGQMGIGLGSSLQQKSYGFQNGAPSGGLGSIGNNVQLMHSPVTSGGHLTASSYGCSSASLRPSTSHFDQQHLMQNTLSQQMIPLTSDGYGVATSAGSAVNNQNINQAVHTKLQTTNKPPINFQSCNVSQQQMPKLQQQELQQQQQMPKLQQQELQQQSQVFPRQLVQHQQSQDHQNLYIKNDEYRQSQLLSNMGSQAMDDQRLNSHGEVQCARIGEQFQLSELQSKFQQTTTAEDPSGDAQMLWNPSGQDEFCSSFSQNSGQQFMNQQHQLVDSQNSFSRFDTGVHSEAPAHSQWHAQLQEKFHIPGLPSQKHHDQEEFLELINGQGDAQYPHLSSNGTMTSQASAARLNAAPTTSNAATLGQESAPPDCRNQIRWLLFLNHARYCSAPEGKCLEVNCIRAQQLLKHMEECEVDQCSYPRCHGSKVLIQHIRKCQQSTCPVCIPVRQYLESHKPCAHLPFDAKFANSVCGSRKPSDAEENAAQMAMNSSSPTVEASEGMHSLVKRVKVEHCSPSPAPTNERSSASVPARSQSHASQDADSQICQQFDPPINIKCEYTEAMRGSSVSIERETPFINEGKKDSFEDVYNMKLENGPMFPNGPAVLSNQETMKEEKGVDMAKQETDQEMVRVSTEQSAGTKSSKPKIKGVSLTELFTPEEIRRHITGLRQWVGQSKAKAEKNQAMKHSMSENSCQLCAVEKLTFEPPPLYCTLCGARIKRNAMYYTMQVGETRHYFCIPCYNEPRGEKIVVDGAELEKARMEKKKNDEEAEEWWVQCDKCEAWQHQICALFNGRRNDGGEAEYTCPNCYISEVERGERKPLPQSAVLGAKDLPRTILSDHIEHRLFRRLRQERQDRARLQGKNFDEVPGAEALVVRVVSSVDKKLEVKQRFLETFQEENYPTEFPYKSKVILLFQKIEGVEVCLFGMYVQEFGSECLFPNQRRVYLSYLDSVKYFRPEIKAVTGEALRTFVYHEILIAYLEYCKKRGFTSCYIWACPPLKGEDYILYCHPEIQKTPKSDKLREWYLSMLRKAAKENIVVDLTNLYDHFFISTGECKAKVTAARLPYFDGDYWPGAAEEMINQLRQEEDGRRQQKKGKTKKILTKRALKAAGQTDLSGNASKDILLMQKLGETISPMKEDFIMVHLQHACSHCCNLMASGTRWVCSQCKNFQLCDKCYDVEKKLEERERHPIHSRDKHRLHPVEVIDVPEDTKDQDEILESEFFDTRQAFLSLCQGNHYQYDTLRRAKHSSMMVLYHLHNPTAPAFVTTCNICHNDIETGQGWRCEICPDYDLCNSCYQKDGGVDHPHRLTNYPSVAERDAQSAEARQIRVLQLRKMLELLAHASLCRFPPCPYPHCRKVKGLFRHGIQCKIRASGGCLLCKKMWYLLQLHARACKESECRVPRCRDLKDHLRRLQQQSDSRRRAAVMEMMRQRAAEVAGNSG